MHDFQSFFYNVSHGLSLSFAAGHTKTADLMLSKDVCILHYETEKKNSFNTQLHLFSFHLHRVDLQWW